MPAGTRFFIGVTAFVAAIAAIAPAANAQKKYDPGATDAEIRRAGANEPVNRAGTELKRVI